MALAFEAKPVTETVAHHEISSDNIKRIKSISDGMTQGQSQEPIRALSVSGSLLRSLEVHTNENNWTGCVGGILVTEGAVSSDAVVDLVRKRWACYMRFRSLVVRRKRKDFLVDLGKDFDPSRNVIVVKTPISTWEDLSRYCESILQDHFRSDLPPWELHLISGFDGGKCCLVGRFSHALGDGFTWVQLLVSLTDPAPESTSPESTTKVNRQKIPLVKQLVRIVWNTPYALLVAIGASIIFEPRSPLRGGKLGSNAELRFSRPIDLADLKKVIKPFGASVNDAVVALIGGAAKRYIEKSGVEVPKLVTTGITFNTRGTSLNAPFEERTAGNRSTFLFLPTYLRRSLRERLLDAKSSVDRLKSSPIMIAAALFWQICMCLLSLVGPVLVANMYVWSLNFFGVARSFTPSLTLTNVPGPADKICLAGSKVVAVQAFVNHFNIFTVFSYAGEVRITFTADALNLDADLMIECLDEEVDELLKKGL